MLLYQPRPLLFWRYYSGNGNLFAVVNAEIAVSVNEKLSYTYSKPDDQTFDIIVTIGSTGYSQLPDIELPIEVIATGLTKAQVKTVIMGKPDYKVNIKIVKDGVTVGEAKSTTSKNSEIEIIT